MEDPVCGVAGTLFSLSTASPFSPLSSVLSSLPTSAASSFNSSFPPSSFNTATVNPLVLPLPKTLLADANAGEIQPDVSPKDGKAADQIEPAMLVEWRFLPLFILPWDPFKAEGLSDKPLAAAVVPQRDGAVPGVKKPALDLLPPRAAAAVLIRGPGAVARDGPKLSALGGARRLPGKAVRGVEAGAITPPETLARAAPDRCGMRYLPVPVSGAEFGAALPVCVAVADGESPPGVPSDGVMGDRSGKLNDTLLLWPFFALSLLPVPLTPPPSCAVAWISVSPPRGDSAAL
jgi:hypothetical protein